MVATALRFEDDRIFLRKLGNSKGGEPNALIGPILSCFIENPDRLSIDHDHITVGGGPGMNERTIVPGFGFVRRESQA